MAGDARRLADSGNARGVRDRRSLARVERENSALRADVAKLQRRLQAMEEENSSLVAALERSERIRVRYKRQLAALQPREAE
jgi:predicted RNase H-like nuclease (RuvC/YqgF family)